MIWLFWNRWFSLLVLTLYDSRSLCRDRVDSASDKTIANSCFWCSVLVCLGSYEKMPETVWTMNNRNLFLETWIPSSGCQHGQVLIKALFRIVDTHVAPCPPRMEGAKEPWGLFLRGTIPFLRVSHYLIYLPSGPTCLPKAHLLIPSFWGLGLNKWVWGWDKHSEHSTQLWEHQTSASPDT